MKCLEKGFINEYGIKNDTKEDINYFKNDVLIF